MGNENSTEYSPECQNDTFIENSEYVDKMDDPLFGTIRIIRK